MDTTKNETWQHADGAKPGLARADGSASDDFKTFRNQVYGYFVDYFPKEGEVCEYQIRIGEWIPCEIIREQQRNPTRYLARYRSHTGQLKNGVVSPTNLRRSSQNDGGQP